MSEYEVTTPIDTFEHPHTGSVIDIVSLVHVGLPAYYRKLGGYIMARQDAGFIVHNEGITENNEATAAVPPLERIKQKLTETYLDQSAENFALVEVHSGYTFQGSSKLFRDEGSENHDVSKEYVATNTGFFRHIKLIINAKRLAHKLKKEANNGSDPLDEFIFGVIKTAVTKVSSSKRRRTRYGKVMIDMRDQAALEGVDEALVVDDSARLVLVWGMGHLAGLSSGLIERGYQHSNRQEVQAAFSRPTFDRYMEKTKKELQKLNSQMARQRSDLSYYRQRFRQW